jgi:hypothetical protein
VNSWFNTIILLILCTFTYSRPRNLANKLTPWRRVVLQKLVKKFFVLYGTWRLNTVFITARKWTLFWSRWVQYSIFQPIYLGYILVLSSYRRLHLASVLILSDFPTKLLFATSSLSWSTARHRTLLIRWVQSTTSKPISIGPILILSSHLFSSYFPTKLLYIFSFLPFVLYTTLISFFFIW